MGDSGWLWVMLAWTYVGMDLCWHGLIWHELIWHELMVMLHRVLMHSILPCTCATHAYFHGTSPRPRFAWSADRSFDCLLSQSHNVSPTYIPLTGLIASLACLSDGIDIYGASLAKHPSGPTSTTIKKIGGNGTLDYAKDWIYEDDPRR